MGAAFLSFCDEMKKIAFGPEEARKVLRIAKKRQLSLRAAPALVGDAAHMLPKETMVGALGTKGTRAAQELHEKVVRADLARGGVPAEATDQTMSVIRVVNKKNLDRVRQYAPQGVIMSKGSAPAAMEAGARAAGIPAPPRPPANQRMMLDAVMKGHELDESLAKPRIAFKMFGHNSPDVILREHNRLATLPAEHAPVRDYIRQFRAQHESPVLSQYGIDLGKSDRLSRHARKRITEHLERRAKMQLGVE